MNRRGKGIRGVLITTYLLTMGIALVIGFSIFNKINEQIQGKKDYVNKVEDTRTFMSLLDLFLDKNVYISQKVAVDKEIQNALANKQKIDEVAISKVLNDCLTSSEAIQSIHIVDTYGTVVSEYSVLPYKKHTVHFLSQFNIPKINERHGGEYIGIGRNYISGEVENTLYIGRSIRSKETLEQLGYLIIFLDPSSIREATKDYIERTNFEAILVDQESKESFCFLPTGVLEERYKAYLEGSLNQVQQAKWTDRYDHAELDYSRVEMKLIGTLQTASKDDNWLNIMLGVTLINFIFLCIMIVILGKKVVYPLENIALKAKRVTEEGDLSIRFETDEAYMEAGLIGKALNEMLSKVAALISEVKEKERMQRILELSVINHQVNPHFLYNTLNSVAVLVAVEDKDNAQKLIKSLSKYYRACLNQEDLNTVEQELTILKEYINIMLIKNPALLEVTYSIDEDLKEEKLPRMILQTLIENSIKYGIKTMDEPLEISVKIEKDQSQPRMIVIVRDNGKGMEEKIRTSIFKEEKLHNKSGFGLRSIIKRLSLMYQLTDVKDILEIHTSLNEYTEIVIYIPFTSTLSNKKVQQCKLFKES